MKGDKRKMLKKLSSYLLVFLTLILSLGTVTGCVFDPSINVKRDGNDAYIYNGERYIYTQEMENYIDTYTEGKNVGYASTGIGLKVQVQVSNRDLEENVIQMMTDYHYPSFCHPFYVKESASFPTSPWEAKYSSVRGGEEIEMSFQLKNMLAKSPSYQDFSEMRWTMILCYLEDFHPICLSLNAYLDSQKNIYVGYDSIGHYKVIDEEFKAAVMQVCKPYFE